jgi:hypothetical protein
LILSSRGVVLVVHRRRFDHGLYAAALAADRYLEFVILRNSGSGMKPSRLGILIFGKVFLSSFPSAGKIPFKLRM